jgi:hypothetical protein
MGVHAVFLDDSLYCFGGDPELEVPFALSTKTWTWTVPLIKSPEKVPPLIASAIAAADGKIYLHGGRTANGTVQPKVYVITPKRLIRESTKDTPKWRVERGSEAWNALERPRAVPDEDWI